MRIAVLGVGLIGGSIGLAARRRLGAEVVGCEPSPATRRAGASSWARSTAAPARSPRPARAPSSSSAPAPVGGAAGAGRARRSTRCRPRHGGHRRRLDQARAGRGARATTSASSAATRWPGAETAGVENARADLFEGARWYLTPTERSSGLLYDRLQRDDRRARRPAAGDRRRGPRPPDGDGQPPAARARQRARRRGGGGADRGLRAACPRSGRASATRPASPAPTRRSGPTSSPATARRSPTRSTSVGGRLREAAELIRARRPRGGRRLARGRRRGPAPRCWRPSSQAGPLRELRIVVANRPGTIAELALALGEAGVNIEDMALHPAPDMTSGAVSLWVAGDEQAERARAAGPRARPHGHRPRPTAS